MYPSVNPLFFTDSYKLDHRRQYPAGTTRVYSNFTPRTSRLPDVESVVLFGLQAWLNRLNDAFRAGFFYRPVNEVCEEYEERVASIVGPNEIGSDHVRALHGLRYLPLEIRALPEGTEVPLRVPMFTIENTHPDFAWLVNYLESWLSADIWQPCTSATLALRMRRLLDRVAIETTGSTEGVQWQGHDFSYRGMANNEAATASAAAHLLAFTGSDSVAVHDWIDYHFTGHPSGILSGSVPATEHSVMCAGGSRGERATFSRLLDLYPSGIVSVVSDTWDLWEVLTEILPSLHGEIMTRDGKLVIRPDSGDPVDIICGDETADPGSPAHKGVIELLWDEFGGTVNDLGFKVLDPHVGAIYGDSITYERGEKIAVRLAGKRFASMNVVLGVGSFTYQYVTRDTFGFAMKATWAEIDGQGRELFKDPVTDNGVKRSARGRLAVVKSEETGRPTLVDGLRLTDGRTHDLLRVVYRDGVLIDPLSYDQVRANVGVLS